MKIHKIRRKEVPLNQRFKLLLFILLISSCAYAQNYRSIFVGNNASAGIKNDGTLWTWGLSYAFKDSTDFERDIPRQVGKNTDWKQVALERWLGMVAIKTNGTLWQIKEDKQLQISSDTDWRFIYMSSYNQMRIVKSDGSIWLWKDDNLACLIPAPQNHNQWTQVVENRDTILCLSQDSTLWIFEKEVINERESKVKNLTPSPFLADKKWKQISCSLNYFAAIRADNTLWMWGSLFYIKDFQYASIYYGNKPTQVGTDKNWHQISCYESDIVAIRTDGTLWAWGNNTYMQLGLGTVDPILEPQKIGLDNHWTSVKIGENHTLALTKNGTVHAWGDNFYGQLGNGTDDFSRNYMEQTGNNESWKQISVADNSVGGVKKDGSLWVWGRYGPLQHIFRKEDSRRIPPQRQSEDSDWRECTMGITRFGIKTDGSLWSCGFNGNSQLGYPTDKGVITTSFKRVDSSYNWKQVIIVRGAVFALKQDGSLWYWGKFQTREYNGYEASPIITPTRFGDGANWAKIYTGGNKIMAIKTDGSLWTWGDDYIKGTLANFRFSTNPVQVGIDTDWNDVVISSDKILASKKDGTMWIWGDWEPTDFIDFGKFWKDFKIKERYIDKPLKITTNITWKKIFFSDNFVHAVIIKEDGTLHYWRDGIRPLSQDTDWDDVKIEGRSIFAMKKNGTIWALGQNDAGELGISTVSDYRSKINENPNNLVYLERARKWKKAKADNAEADRKRDDDAKRERDAQREKEEAEKRENKNEYLPAPPVEDVADDRVYSSPSKQPSSPTSERKIDPISRLSILISSENDISKRYQLYGELIDTQQKRLLQKPEDENIKASLLENYEQYSHLGLLMRQYAQAEAIARKGLLLDKNNLHLNYAVADALLLQGQYNKAKELYFKDYNSFVKVTMIDPITYEAKTKDVKEDIDVIARLQDLENEGVKQIDIKKMQEDAVDKLIIRLRKNMSDKDLKEKIVTYYVNSSRSQLLTKLYKNAQQQAEKGLKIDPENPNLSYALADALLFQGQYNKAEALYFKDYGSFTRIDSISVIDPVTYESKQKAVSTIVSNNINVIDYIERLEEIDLYHEGFDKILTLATQKGISGSYKTPQPSTLDLRSKKLTEIPQAVLKNKQLDRLYLNYNQIENMPVKIGRLKQLEHLFLGTNRLTSLPAEIGNLTKLTHLDLSDNQLTNIPLEIGNLTKLTELYLSENQLTNLPVEIGNLTLLTNLNLYSNKLTWIAKEIGHLAQLNSLNLSANQLTKIPTEIGELTQLKKLDVSGNQLTSLPAEIGKLTQLKELGLSSNELTTLPGEIGKLTQLKELGLSSNQWMTLPPEIGKLINLRTLELRYNPKLTSLPAEIGNLVRLTKLNLAENQLSNLPTTIGNLTNLTELHLNENQLTSIPKEIGNLTNLTELYLYRNQLTHIPAEIGNLTNLTTLYLSQNQLTYIPAEIENLTNLPNLYLSSNQLTSIPAKIGKLTKLTELDLTKNKLIRLPTEIGQLTKLTKLRLGDNQLTSIPAEIGQLTNLTELNLTENRLTSIPIEIGQLTNLTSLGLSGNHLKSLPAQIGELTNLKDLYLHENQLTTVPVELGRLVNLNYLNLSKNPISEAEQEKIKKLLPNCKISF